MKNQKPLEPCLTEAIEKLEDYITKTTGKKPSQTELADALGRFFVLKEIREFIEMTRQEEGGST